jgi:hypothetical protein
MEEFEGEELPLEELEAEVEAAEEGDVPPPPNERSESSAEVAAGGNVEESQPERTLVQNMDDLIRELADQEKLEDVEFGQIEVVPAQLQGDIKELEFYIDAEMWEEARILLNELKEKAPDLQALDTFRSMIEERE